MASIERTAYTFHQTHQLATDTDPLARYDAGHLIDTSGACATVDAPEKIGCE